MPISAQYFNEFNSQLPKNTTLVAVSKTKPIEDVYIVHSYGQRDFGENKVQEMCDKHQELPKDIRWHMIGHLQRNKVKFIAPFVYLIHSVDSIRLLKEIDKQAQKLDKKINILLQVYIADEESKFGFDKDELLELLSNDFLGTYPNIQLKGLMGMATFSLNKEKISNEFSFLKAIYDEVKENNDFLNEMNTLSMGMSGDYKIALENGSNMVRVGSMIFGNRNKV